jgi:peptide/nickel transport system substrate-binding protein
MRRVPAIVACLLSALVLAPAALADTHSRDLRVATTTKIDTLNPLTGTLAAEYRVWALNYDLLIAFDQKSMQPDEQHSLAQSWEHSKDGLTWTYHLRPGLEWSDGKPLTAHDVVWTMNFLAKRVKSSAVTAVKSWKTDGDLTVVAHMKHPSVEMESLWIYILPAHVWKAANTKKWEEFIPPLPLVGSGPYTVTSWNPNATTVMERNPHFRGTNTGPERVLMTYYGDENGAVTDLEQNRLDVMPADTLNAPDVPRLERTSGVRVYHSPAIGLEYWVFNLAPRVTSRVHTEVIRSRAIRVALAWAIDRSALVQAALQGYGAPGNTQLSRNYGAYTLDLSKDSVLGYHYDPEKAKRILDQAGWRVGPDGIRRNPDGVRASFELAYAGLSTEKRAVTLIRAWARDVGIEIDVRVYDNDKLINLEFNMDGKKLTPDFDTEIWSIGGDPTPEFLLSLFTKDQIGVWNDSGFTDPDYERLFKRETRATEEATRIEDIHTLQHIVTADLPYIELYEPDDLGAVNTRTWQNWTTQPSPDGQPITSYGWSTIVALKPGELASASYPGVPWAIAGLVALAALAIGSSFIAHRREQREPIEIADAPTVADAPA